MYLKIDHLAVLVNDIDEAVKIYKDLGFTHLGTCSFPHLGFDSAFFPVGESFIHLIKPTNPQNAAGKFLQKHGEGFYAVAMSVAEPAKASEALKKKGVQTIEAASGEMIFIHPKSARGLMIQLLDVNNKAREMSLKAQSKK